jgi:hypothetical protein
VPKKGKKGRGHRYNMGIVKKSFVLFGIGEDPLKVQAQGVPHRNKPKSKPCFGQLIGKLIGNKGGYNCDSSLERYRRGDSFWGLNYAFGYH